jgi:hypothetical protein
MAASRITGLEEPSELVSTYLHLIPRKGVYVHEVSIVRILTLSPRLLLPLSLHKVVIEEP